MEASAGEILLNSVDKNCTLFGMYLKLSSEAQAK
jgi:imidazole glycerol phosphate synthase subunit HisF